jgi:hypothetical protein
MLRARGGVVGAACKQALWVLSSFACWRRPSQLSNGVPGLLVLLPLQMYSLAWKAATGVAAVEGLAVGGWSCKTVRVQQAEAAQSAAEASRLRQQAGQELGAMRALLEQHKATHTHEVREAGLVISLFYKHAASTRRVCG